METQTLLHQWKILKIGADCESCNGISFSKLNEELSLHSQDLKRKIEEMNSFDFLDGEIMGWKGVDAKEGEYVKKTDVLALLKEE